MNSRSISKGIIVSILLSAVALFSLSAQIDVTYARVNLTGTDVILARDFNPTIEAYEQQQAASLTAEQKDQLLNAEINQMLISQAAERANVTASDQEILEALQLQLINYNSQSGQNLTFEQFIQAMISGTDYTYEDVRESIATSIIQEKYIEYARPNLEQSIPQPTEAQIVAAYEANAQGYYNPVAVRLSHIFINTLGMSEEQFNTAVDQMQTYEDRIESGGNAEFNTIVSEVATNTQVIGGELGYVWSTHPTAVSTFGTNFMQRVLAMQRGAVSGLIQSNVGLHIVRVDDRTLPRTPGLDEARFPGETMTVRQDIVQRLRALQLQQAKVQAAPEIIAELREEADIRIFEQNLPWKN